MDKNSIDDAFKKLSAAAGNFDFDTVEISTGSLKARGVTPAELVVLSRTHPIIRETFFGGSVQQYGT